MHKKIIAVALLAISLTACGSNTKATDTTKLPAVNETATDNQKAEEADNKTENSSDSVETTNDEIKKQPLLEQRLYAEEKQKDSMPEKMPDTLELVVNGQKIDFNKNASQFSTLNLNVQHTMYKDDGTTEFINDQPIDLNEYHLDVGDSSNDSIDYEVADDEFGLTSDTLLVILSNYTGENITMNQATVKSLFARKSVSLTEDGLQLCKDGIDISVNGVKVGEAKPADVRAVFGIPTNKIERGTVNDGSDTPLHPMITHTDLLDDPKGDGLYYPSQDWANIKHLTYANDNYLVTFELVDPTYSWGSTLGYEDCIVNSVEIEPRAVNHKFKDAGVNAPN